MRSLIAVILLSLASSAAAQLPGDDYRGVVATGLALRELATTKRVLVIAAHPDDEDTQLISVLGLGQGADVAYLSLTRGEGGQNSIGGELGAALGVLRTGELLAARELDRAEQFFSRAYDFGYSKTAEETLDHWPRDSVLADVVSVVRRYRPDIIVAVFTGTPSDGHGQHQVSGMLAREAFDAAADPARFPEQIRAGLLPHRALKLFRSANFRGTPTHRLSTGDLDPLLGRSYAQVAAASRSRHRSQDFGLLQLPGPRTTALALEQSRVAAGANGSLFAGIDTTLAAKAMSARESSGIVSALQRYDSLVARARAQLSPYSSEATAATLGTIVRELASLVPRIRDAAVRAAAAAEFVTAQHALVQAAGVIIDPVSSTTAAVPGTSFTLDVTVWNGGTRAVQVADIGPALPADWRAERTDSASFAVAPGTAATYKFTISVPAAAAISQPYFLARPRNGDTYAWPAGHDVAGLPFAPAPVQAAATIDIAGAQAHVSMAATLRTLDRRQGELRRLVHVPPAFTLRPEPAVSVMPMARVMSGSNASIAAAVEVAGSAGGRVVVAPVLPSGWRAQPGEVALDLPANAEARVASFSLAPPRDVAAGTYTIRFVARDSAGRSYDLNQRAVDYPHIANRLLFEPAELRVTILNVQLARGMRVGYIVGVDADVAPVLEQLGITVERLDADALANADLGRFDAVVVGSRAYELRPDLIANHTRLLEYGRNGGNILVLYQQYEFVRGNFAPYALTIERPHDRITDENAAVRFLDAGAPALARPNRISQHDFAGWVQDRALYMPRTWAPEYRPLLEMADPGEAPKQGAIITAPLGSGRYTYTGIAFFRQIPAGVPGALRLFVNLLSIGMNDAAF